MRILSAGMHRSGSTWLYNAIRYILIQKRVKNITTGFVYEQEETPDNKNSVIKIHTVNKHYIDWADKIFYCYRDIRDVAASFIRWRGEKPNRMILEKDIKNFAVYKPLANLSVEYNRITKEPEQVLTEIADILGHKIKPKAILKKLDAMKKKKLKNTDPETLLRVGHITDGRSGIYKKDLPPDYLEWLEDKYGWWLKENNYMEK